MKKMRKLIIPKNQIHNVLPVLNRNTTYLKVVVISVGKRKNPFLKGEMVRLYYWNLNSKLRFFGVIQCKNISNLETGKQIIMLRTTYDRRYYLNRLIKKDGFELKLEQTAKTVFIPPEFVQASLKNQTLIELNKSYNYGIQYTIL